MFRRLTILLIAALAGSPAVEAQRVTISANALDCIDFGTLNAEVGIAVSRHISINAGAKYNPWKYGNEEKGYVQNCRRTFSAGMRYWLWNIHSGWWLSFKGQYEEYNRSLPVQQGKAEEGDALGVGFSIGYALMLNRHFNIDFGLGAWGGGTAYTTYACPRCGSVLESGRKGFIRPNDVQASLVYIF